MKILYVCFGFIFMTLGVIGILLPVMPTVPFLFVAYWSFRRGSRKFNDWYAGTRLHKYYVKSIERFKKMPLRNKVLYFTAMTIFIMGIFSVWIALAPYAYACFKQYFLI